MPKKLFYSNIPRLYGGAGDYLDYLLDRGFYNAVVIPDLKNRFWKFSLIFNRLKAYLLIINRYHLTIYHPQTLGYLNTCFLIMLSKQINIYFVDTSFFCKSSYNSYRAENCTRCLKSFSPHKDCKFIPIPSTNYFYKFFLRTCQININKINFIVQTQKYADMVVTKFGKESKVLIQKMKTNELIYTTSIVHKRNEIHYFDISFHGSAIDAKGLKYFLELARYNNDLKFFLPSAIDYKIANLTSQSCSWNSGLQGKLLESSIILCPSIWSASVEASVLKSLLLGRPVGVMNTSTAIEELGQDSFIILTGDIPLDSKNLRRVLSSNELQKKYILSGIKSANGYLLE